MGYFDVLQGILGAPDPVGPSGPDAAAVFGRSGSRYGAPDPVQVLLGFGDSGGGLDAANVFQQLGGERGAPSAASVLGGLLGGVGDMFGGGAYFQGPRGRRRTGTGKAADPAARPGAAP